MAWTFAPSALSHWLAPRLYEPIPNMPQHRFMPLMEKFAEAVSRAGVFPSAIAAPK
jgi:hypothetical protein